MSKSISTPDFELSTLIDLLRWRVAQQPDRRVFSFLTDGEIEKEYLTFADLDRQARIVAAALQSCAESGARALLIYPSGLEFIAAFFGCLYSGIIAVPVYPPSATRSDRTLTKFRAIANDVEPAVVLTTTSLSSRVEGLLAQSPEIQKAQIIITDTIPFDMEEQWKMPAISADALAFFQYTSGSTGMPKGVMVTHGNLLHNSSVVARYCEHPATAHGVTWLPLYHDLGLIGGILQPIYSGYESTIMSPATFLQRPFRWLQAVSRTKATISGGPNFAYDLCVRKITPEQKAQLDLSHWEVAANGAEPVRPETIERFSEAFASCGFRREAFYPCYGLAEATLVVSGNHKGQSPIFTTFQEEALEQNRVVVATEQDKNPRRLVSSGWIAHDEKVVIVNPDTLASCQPDEVGEIWVSSPSITKGYWQKAEETERIFNAHISDTGEGPFLRTGDLGFLKDGELFITGRLKDMIIIRGSNHYPQDIELTVEHSHAGLRAGCGVAFSVEVQGEERLVLVQEVERQYLRSNLDEIVAAIRAAVAERHELQPYAVALIKTGSIHKTSSGKVQRRSTREAFLNGTLDTVYEWRLGQADQQPMAEREAISEEQAASPEIEQARPGHTAEEIQNWLIAQIAELLQVKASEIDVNLPFAHYGMDSLQAISIAGDLEDWLGSSISPTLVYDYPTIAAVARHLAGEPQELPAREESQRPTTTDAIAIVGLGCRFPGAESPEEFWQLLRNGLDGISEVPEQRWDLQKFYAPEQATPGKMNTRWGGFLKQVDQFDPYFFGIAPREASRMDPQQRLLLEVAWEALEYAGIAPNKLAGSQTGVFVGISSSDYSQIQFSNPALLDAYAGTGNAHSIAANRLSYLLDLRGPSMAMDTACSSSLLAVHMACQSLRNGECDMALAGGVNLILTPELTITFSQAHMMSADGHCKTFDDSADGYVRSEGCGIVVLKPLSKALQDGDNILAVIRGSAVNQDGRSNGLTAPNGPSQEAVIRQALRNADVTADQISYVETHGSSTPLGDPIEFDSLKAVLMQQRSSEQPCLLGSVKTNIGHLEAAAGVAGLIKTVLSLHKGEIPPHLHLKKLNSHISLEGTTFEIPTSLHTWPAGRTRLAGVSAFGFGGTNVHMILEEAPKGEQATSALERPLHQLTLSAQSEKALRVQAQNYAAFLAQHPEVSIANASFTANTGRTHFAHRLAITAADAAQLQEQLTAYAQGQSSANSQYGHIHVQGRRKIAFLFTGQGSQYVGMGRELYETQPTFRKALDRCAEILQAYLSRPLLSVLYPAPNTTSPLDETEYTQPALFALEYALAELWRSWGIEPDIVMGHSVGEYVAACVAGMFSLEDGLKLITMRARLMQAQPQVGEMVVIFAEQLQLQSELEPFQDKISIAAINGPKNTVISGEREAVKALVQRLQAKGLTTHPMTVSHAFHSPLMEPLLDTFERVADQIDYAPVRIPLVCNLTGQILSVGETLNASYWRQHTRQPVKFAAGMQALAEKGFDLFLELGPTPVLSGMGKRCLPEDTRTWTHSLRRGQNDWQALLNSVATLYIQGIELDWSGLDSDYSRQRLPLPTYPFEREHCWIEISEADTRSYQEAPVPSISQGAATGRHPLLDTHMELVHPAETHIWEIELDKHRLPYLNDHRIQGAMALPVSVYVEMAQAATVEVFGPGTHVLTGIELKKLLLLPEQGSQKVQVVLSSDANEQVSFQVYSHSAGVPDQPRKLWTLHAVGKISHN
ncbi:acyltransferase domain-containing protein [Ktedonosporobacter rubrisoli]|uniref:Acyltransferase domain-containing protein n=1 Tax=Ktedonosporobacter rubrisoli TaxID=2509675 RepID=A0A4P6JT93_KTERU|nr:type I polyketide synthase [Ktedonosporobacter rubrisoli]QBD78788.1 acyltransferase domain-containing protein [Ktedonosporobacter rubrisoli]